MQVGSLFMALGFDVDDKKLDEFSDKVGGLRKGLLGVAGTAAAGVAALGAMTLKASDTAVSLSNINLLTGEATESMQRLASVAVGTNPLLGMQEALQGIAGMFDTIVDAEWGEGATGALAQLGITDVAQRSIEDMFMELRRVWNEELAGITQGKKIRMFGEANVPRELINMIAAPQAEFDRLYNREIVDDAQIEALNQFRNDWEEFTYQSGQLYHNLAAMSASYSESVLEPIGNFLGNMNEHFTKQSEINELEKSKPRPSPLVQGDDIGYFEAWGKLLSEMVGYNPDRWIENRLRNNMPVPERDMQRYINQNTNYNNTNNFNVETTADPREVAEQIINLSNENQNRGDIAELPYTAGGGIR